MSTTIHIVPGMQVTNPIGIVDINPLPSGLPPELRRAHLVRSNLSRVAVNIVTGQTTGLQETNISGAGQITYTPTTAFGSDRGSGWVDEDWPLEYASGLTWCAVAAPGPDAPDNVVTILGNMNWQDGDDAGPFMAIGQTNFRMAARVGGDNVTSIRSVTGAPEGLYMMFGTLSVVGAVGTLRSYVPHTEQVSQQTFDASGWAPVLNAGTGINRSTSNFSNVTDAPIAFVAEAGADWNESQMLSFYNLMKPWLASRGVVIL